MKRKVTKAKRSTSRRKNLWPFSGSKTQEKEIRVPKGKSARKFSVRHAIAEGCRSVRSAVRDATRGKKFTEINVDATASANPKRKRKRNFFLDRFIGSKPRVTATDWNRAGEARRAKALRSAGVSKKLLPMYTDMSWRDMQALDGGFVKKVMAGLPARKNSAGCKKAANRKKPRKAVRKPNSEIGKKMRSLIAQGMSREEALKTAMRQVKSGYTKKGSYKRSKRRNPDKLDRAGETYAMFHGRGPKEVITLEEMGGPLDQVGKTPRTTAALGDLVCLIVGDGADAYRVDWGKGERPLLATDTNATQLYIVGGNQNLDTMLRQLELSQAKAQVLDLGEVAQIEYYTQKDFDNFEPIIYYHQFGEEDAKKNPRSKVRRPRLIYSRKNKKLLLTGGAYKIKGDGIIN
jgi:hypothetical protein